MNWNFFKSLERIETKIDSLTKQGKKTQMDLDALIAKVTDENTVIDSAITLLGTLSADLKAALGDPTKIQAIADTIDAEKAKLAAAIVANTPSA